MKARMNLLLAAALVVAAIVCAGPSEESKRPSDTPISVIASTTGRFAKVRSWHLSVNSAGRAHLTIYTYPKPSSREFDITAEQIDKLSEALEKEQFFALKADYGEPDAVDTSKDRITIVRGNEANTVSIHYLMDWLDEPSKLKEPARAVRVFQVIRGWFDDKDAVNLKKYDEKVLEAAAKSQ